MSALTSTLMRPLAWLSNLKVAIALLFVIALSSGIGTAIPQKETTEFYHQRYDPNPWLGFLPGDGVIKLQLDHVYSSQWFLALLALLALALILCSWRRQWPALQASLRWIDYRRPRQLSKLAIAETLATESPETDLDQLEHQLQQGGWQIRRQKDRLAARRGVAGRVGPLLVHAGLVVLMLGASWGALAGQRLERFLAPGHDLELLNPRGQTQLTLALDDFSIQRDPAGRPEQFTSKLRLLPPGDSSNAGAPLEATISVNHPLRHKGITLYQADWALVAVNLQIGRSPVLQLPLQAFPQLGEQIWGLVLPTRPDGSQPVLVSLGSEQGPAQVFNAEGQLLAQIIPGGPAVDVMGLPLRIESVLPASGILLKKDPGVPLVYSGFAISLLGGALSLIATRQLWAIAEGEGSQGRLHLGGLCNRNLTALATELPAILQSLRPTTTP